MLRSREPRSSGTWTGLDDPSSPKYQHYLTARQIGARFGLADAALARVKRQLRAAGLVVNVGLPAADRDPCPGTVARISAFLRTTLARLQGREGPQLPPPPCGSRYPCRDRPATVVGVTGLSTKSLPMPADMPTGGLTPKTTAKAYNIAPLHSAGIQGQGQTVAIVSFDSFNDSDPKAFDRQFGITGPKVIHRKVAGGAPVGSGSDEVNLDIDVVRSIAPKAQIINYEAPNGGVGFGDVMNAIVADGKADIASISWGNCDDPSNRSATERRSTLQS